MADRKAELERKKLRLQQIRADKIRKEKDKAEKEVGVDPGGVLRLKEVLGTCRGIGSHFHPSGK